MRTYFEAAHHSRLEGLINDPRLDGSFDVNEGLKLARQLLVDINEMGMPTATGIPRHGDRPVHQRPSSPGRHRARTTESQVHREMASALSCPVGFKNGTDGNTRIAIDAVRAARHSHIFYSPDKDGKMTIYPYRRQPLWPRDPARRPQAQLRHRQHRRGMRGPGPGGPAERLVVDFSHGNSMKDHRRQLLVAQDICDQLRRGRTGIAGIMAEASWWKGVRTWRTAAPPPSVRASPMPALLGRHRDPAGHAGRGRQGAVGQAVGLNRQCNERGRISAISCPSVFTSQASPPVPHRLGINQTGLPTRRGRCGSGTPAPAAPRR